MLKNHGFYCDGCGREIPDTLLWIELYGTIRLKTEKGNAEDVMFVVLDRVAKVIADGNGLARIAEKYIEVEENDGT